MQISLTATVYSCKYSSPDEKYQDFAFTFLTDGVTVQRLRLWDVCNAIVTRRIDATTLNELEIIG